MLRHFNIFPPTLDKEDLYEDQKIFLIYLMAQIPELDHWKRNVEYKTKLAEIKQLDINKIKIDQTIIDLAVINGKDMKQLRKEQLFLEKKKRITELNKEYGIRDPEKEAEKTVEIKQDINDSNPTRLWDILHGKGLVK